MNPILVKIFATALALSQVTTQPDAVKTQLDPVRDQAEVVQLLQAGCSHIRKVFDIESINLDDLITTAMDDPQAMSGNIKALHGLKFDDLFTAYRQFCKNEAVPNSPVDIGEVRIGPELADASDQRHVLVPVVRGQDRQRDARVGAQEFGDLAGVLDMPFDA